ncbi:MAG TPA: PLD nuclease N-terminal domain-containing protein [Pseudogracilibacillus sp.]|nr:PLD nuclease N-terminal domain-containing protein [Pseudogracilibacillus sp.]
MIGETINWSLIAPLLIIQALLTFFALIDWVKQEETRGPKILWLFIILFVSMLGPVLYFVIGKKE